MHAVVARGKFDVEPAVSVCAGFLPVGAAFDKDAGTGEQSAGRVGNASGDAAGLAWRGSGASGGRCG
jgi:hypothetical protein